LKLNWKEYAYLLCVAFPLILACLPLTKAVVRFIESRFGIEVEPDHRGILALALVCIVGLTTVLPVLLRAEARGKRQGAAGESS
jgi:hypothetical protein